MKFFFEEWWKDNKSTAETFFQGAEITLVKALCENAYLKGMEDYQNQTIKPTV